MLGWQNMTNFVAGLAGKEAGRGWKRLEGAGRGWKGLLLSECMCLKEALLAIAFVL